MILAVAGTNDLLQRKAVEFAATRSFTEVRVGSRGAVLLIDGLHHYVLCGTLELSYLEPLMGLADFRLVFLGQEPSPDDVIRRELFERADLRSESDTDLEQRLAALVRSALYDFERPSWDEYFMDIARVVSRRANCIKRRIAAVVVKDRRIVSTGYNGTPSGARNCFDGGCERCNSLRHSGHDLDECLCCHAEENAIAQAALHGISISGATIYTTHSPCLRCTKLIVNSGIREVVYSTEYPMAERSLALLEECGVRARRL